MISYNQSSVLLLLFFELEIPYQTINLKIITSTNLNIKAKQGGFEAEEEKLENV